MKYFKMCVNRSSTKDEKNPTKWEKTFVSDMSDKD